MGGERSSREEIKHAIKKRGFTSKARHPTCTSEEKMHEKNIRLEQSSETIKNENGKQIEGK